MSEQTQAKTEHEIFTPDSSSSEVVTDPEKTSSTESPQIPSLSSQNREKQIKVYADRIEKGEITVDGIPEDMKWLKPLVSQEIETRSKNSDIDARVEARLAEKAKEEQEKAQDQKTKDLKKKLQDLELSDSDQALMVANYDRLKAKGLSTADALEEALNVYDTLSKAGEKALEQMKEDMAIPTSGREATKEPKFGTDTFFQVGTSAERVAKMEALRLSSGRM